MEQLSLDFAAPVAPPPKAKKEKPRKKSEWEIACEEREARIDVHMAAMPDDKEALIEIAQDLTRQFDAAARKNDIAAADDIEERAEACANRWNDGQSFGVVKAYDEMRPLLAAPDGVEPMFGQPGRWLVEAAGCRHDFTTSGLFSCLFEGHSVSVIDFEKPYISGTGYRSVSGGACLWGALTDGTQITPTECARRYIERAVGKEKRIIPTRNHMVWRNGEKVQPEPWQPRATDPAWHLGGYIFELRAISHSQAA